MPYSSLTTWTPHGQKATVLVGTGRRDAARVLAQAGPGDHVFHACVDEYGWHAYVKHQASETVYGRKEMRRLARAFATCFNISDVVERWIRNGALAELAIVVMLQEPDDQHKGDSNATVGSNHARA